MLDKAGKTMTIFAILMIVILVSSTSIGFYLYHQEVNTRKNAESDLLIAKDLQAKYQGDITQLKKQLTLLQDKNKEADEKINNLLDEMELNEGLRNELKKENDNLKSQVDGFTKTRDKNKSDLDEANRQLQDIKAKLEVEEKRAADLARQLEVLNTAGAKVAIIDSKLPAPEKVELDKIVVNPADNGIKGRIVSVDKDTEFVICNLGAKQGVKSGDILSVYRGEEYLGDVKATRVQEQLCAADLLPPFSSRKVRKNDIVMIKPQ